MEISPEITEMMNILGRKKIEHISKISQTSLRNKGSVHEKSEDQPRNRKWYSGRVS